MAAGMACRQGFIGTVTFLFIHYGVLGELSL
jgi:hypothetical protein